MNKADVIKMFKELAHRHQTKRTDFADEWENLVTNLCNEKKVTNIQANTWRNPWL